eukprot:5998005-Prymnesium_polylepis.1
MAHPRPNMAHPRPNMADGSGTLDALLAKGFKYMFVSVRALPLVRIAAPQHSLYYRGHVFGLPLLQNSDNLGATMDVKLLTWFAKASRSLHLRPQPTPPPEPDP